MKFARFLIACLLAISLPLQGIAAYAPAGACGDAYAAAVQQGHGAAQHDADAAEHDHQHHAAADSNAGGHDHGDIDGAGGHSCCHHVFTAAAANLVPATPEAPAAVTPRVSLLNTLFIPELPQRPPRA